MTHETARPSGAAALRRRWDENRVAEVRDQLVQQAKIARGPHRVVSPWGAPDVVPVDLRGFPAGKDGLAVHYLTLEALDLSHMKGRLHVYQSELVACTLDGATLAVGSILGRRLERCSLVAARMPKVRLAGTFVDCTFGTAVVSPLTSFERCELRGGGPPVGALRLERCTVDGERIADRWDGRAGAEEIEDRYLADYVEAVVAGRAEGVPLEPESPRRSTGRGGSGGR